MAERVQQFEPLGRVLAHRVVVLERRDEALDALTDSVGEMRCRSPEQGVDVLGRGLVHCAGVYAGGGWGAPPVCTACEASRPEEREEEDAMTTPITGASGQPVINAQAPVVLAGEIEIAAAPELVWDILTTIDGWPDWNKDVRAATLDGTLAAGSNFRWKSGPSTIRSTLRHVEPQRMIAWTGKAMGLSVIHVYALEGRDDRTLVRTEESVEGFMARISRKSLRKTMNRAVENGLRYLKAEAERRAAS